MKKGNRSSSLISLVLVLCMLFSFCAILSSCNDPESKCTHANQSLQNQKAATCAEEGYTGDMVCTDCTAIVSAGTAIAKLEHTYDEGKVTKNPTCIETGILTYTCGACGTIKCDSIATIPHQDVFHDAQDGNHIHTCQLCPLNEKLTHTPTDAGVKVEATCTEGAYTVYTCSVCNGEYKVYSETELALGHDFSDWETVEPTCLAEGSKTQSCKNPGCNATNTLTLPVSKSCNMEFVGYEDGQAPDCIHEAIAVYQCKDCFTETKKNVKATGIHNYQQHSTSDDGFSYKTCTVCYHQISAYDASTKVVADIKTDLIDKNQDLEMNMKEAAIQFPSDVVETLASGSSLSVSADVLDDTTKSNAVNKVTDADTKAALEGAPIYDFSVKVNDTLYTDTFSTKVAITLDYDNGENDADGIVIYYLSEDGTVEAITDVVYNAETKQVSFFVEHFSFYAVAYRETQEMRCKRGNHDYVATTEKQDATCYQLGYTVYECSGCHRQMFDDIVARAEHNYGDIIEGIPTCENGAWSTRICKNPGCHSVLQVQFTGALGHIMDKPASCDSASTCTRCHKILARPLGHDFGEWEVVVEPTEAATGLRRRNCPVCGEIQEEVLAKLGVIEPLKFESYSDLFNLVLKDALNLSSGKIEFSLEIPNQDISATVNATVEETNNGYRMNVLMSADGETVEWYYDNGVFVNVNKTNSYGSVTDINHIVPMSIATYKEILEKVHTQIEDYVVSYLKMARDYISEYKGLYGENINAILKNAGLEYTVDDIDTLVDSVESVYAYLSLKLGYTTGLEMKEEVVLPTEKDFKAVLDLLMEATEVEGVTTYKLTAAPVLKFANDMIAFMEEHNDDTLAEFIYFAIGDELVKYNNTLTDFNKTVDFIAEKFPGTFTVKDALDLYISFAESSGFLSLDQLYDLIDQIAVDAGQEEFNAKEMVAQYETITLDQFAQMIFGSEQANIAALYTQIKEMAAQMVVGTLPIRGTTLTDLTAILKASLAAIDVKADITVTMDADGRIIGMTLDHSFKMQTGDDPEAELTEIESVKFSVTHDDSIEVTIPSSINSMMNGIESSYDDEKNLIIKGLDTNIDYRFDVFGSGFISFADALTKDDTLSKEYGRDVFVLGKEHWNKNYTDAYLLIDGKYYEYTDEYHEVIKPITTYMLSDISSKLIDRLENQNPYILGTLIDTDIPVYELRLNTDDHSSSSLGIAYKKNDTWMVSTQYGSISETEFDPENGYFNSKNSYYIVTEMTIAEFAKTFKLGMTEEYDQSTVQYNDQSYQRLRATVTYGNGSTSILLNGFYENGEFLFIEDYNYVYSPSNEVYVLGAEVTALPEHDGSNIENLRCSVRKKNGDIEVLDVKMISLYSKSPDYYVKVNNSGVFSVLDSDFLYTSMDVSEMETLALPDGNTLYILGTTMDNEYGYQNGYETVYGYVKTVSDLYVQAVALVSEGKVVEVLYRGASDKRSINLSDVYNVNDYVTRDKGEYKISAEIIEKLKNFCATDGSMFYISAVASTVVNDITFNMNYVVESYHQIPEIDLDSILGSDSDDYMFWYDLFGDKLPINSAYDVVQNDDGSISLIFPMNNTVTDITFPSNVELPADQLYTKNTELSEQTGLDIYTFHGSRTTGYSSRYVYRNGKYYSYSWTNNYDFQLVNDLNLATDWRISNTYYRFDMIGAEGLPAQLPVYETMISFGYRHSPYGSNPSITLYTFILDGVMNVAVEASVTGESLLTFERYMPIDEYMKSLKFELFDSTYDNIYYVNGKKTQVYSASIGIYETDAKGNKIEEWSKYSIPVSYVLQNNVKKFVYSTVYASDIIIIDSEPVEIDNSKLEFTRTEYQSNYYNGTVTIAEFSWKEVEEYKIHFIQLAGRMYRYDDVYGWGNFLDDYQDAKLSEWEFSNLSLDKVWYYLVEDTENGIYTYYTEFIPSDHGFTPSGDIVPESEIVGFQYSKVILGYTSDGLPLYEVAYYTTPDVDFEWTEEAQADGTVFLHKNGVGYLKVTETDGTYYVKARKVEMADGSTQIYCFLRNGVLTGNEVSDTHDTFYDGYLSANKNKLTITKEFLEVAASNNRNEFYFTVHYAPNGSTWQNNVTIDYYQLESLFMLK